MHFTINNVCQLRFSYKISNITIVRKMNLKLNTICRICLMNNNVLINIFEEGLADIIRTISTMTINLNDGLPQCICNICFEELNIATRFRKKCETSENKLNDYINSFNKGIETQTLDHNYDKVSILSSADTQDIIICSKSFKNIEEKFSNETFIEPDNKIDLFSGYESESPGIEKQKNGINHTCAEVSTEKYTVHLNNHENFSCKQCDKIFSSQSEINTHSQTHTQVKRKIQKSMHQCEYCGEITKSRAALLKHMTLHSEERPYSCQKCGKSFKLPAFLKKHMLTHSKGNQFDCYYCPKRFALKTSLSAHIKTHSGEKKFPCYICNKRFKAARSLNDHLKVHTGERNFPCDQCDKAFVNRFDLGRHLKLHEKYRAIEEGTYDKTIDKPKDVHQCENCGKFFHSRGDLTKHSRVHTGDRPFKCNYCDKAFTGSSGLTVHLRIHTGKRPYICLYCNMSFAQSSNLKVHMRLHTGDRPFMCSLCDKGFNRKRDLDAHLKKHSSIS